MKILIDRKWKKNTYTIGVMYINGKRFSETMEDKDRGLLDTMSEGEISLKKVYGQTAIPRGTYLLRMTPSPKFGNRLWAKKYNGKVPQIMDVKGFSGIRIHPANTAEELSGCIAPGRNLEKGKVVQSTNYYYKLLDQYIMPAIKKGEKITLTIQ